MLQNLKKRCRLYYDSEIAPGQMIKKTCINHEISVKHVALPYVCRTASKFLLLVWMMPRYVSQLTATIYRVTLFSQMIFFIILQWRSFILINKKFLWR